MDDDTSTVLDRGLEYNAVKSHSSDNLAVAFACAIPVSFRGIFICPWNFPELFHSVSPCRTKKIFNIYSIIEQELHRYASCNMTSHR
jgi:hypothetical protein